MSSDRRSLDRALEALYDSISFDEGQKPQVERLAGLFEPGARLIHAEVGDVNRMSVDEFADMLHERAGTSMLWFREVELARETGRFGCIAQVFSSFEAQYRIHGDEAPRVIRGVNAIQLRQTAVSWLITGLLWSNESASQPLPATLLP